MNVVIATRNPSKLDQIKQVFSGSGFNIHSLDDVGVFGEAEENGRGLHENSLIKAKFAFEQMRQFNDFWVLADDTGFYISALNGLPGVHAARWAGENKQTEEITSYTLDKLQGVSDRSAKFVTVVCAISPQGEELFFTGQVTGQILEMPRVKPQPKMPYSPIFIPSGSNKVWAEMTTEEENLISHRGKAFRETLNYLLTLI